MEQCEERATDGVEAVESSLVAYADESSVRHNDDHQEYLVCAAILERSKLEEIRQELRPLLLPGQMKLHWTDEGSRRRRQIVLTVSGLDVFQVIVTNRSQVNRKTERYRRKCLETLYFELGNKKIADLTLESRQESQNRKDIEPIVALQAAGKCQGIRVTHCRGGDDPLLWIPDVVLGAFNSIHHGETEYWDQLQEKLVLQRNAEGSL